MPVAARERPQALQQLRCYSMSNSNTESNKYHGKPCKYCGNTLRYKSSRGCVDCTRSKLKQWARDNPEKIKESRRKTYYKYRERNIQRSMDYHKSHRDKKREADKKYRNNHKEQIAKQKRKYYLENKDSIREYKRKWNKKNEIRIKKKAQVWYRNNQERIKNKMKMYYSDNTESVKKKVKKYRRLNPEIGRAAGRRRRARLNNSYTQKYNFKLICNHYGNICLRCKKGNVKLTADHIIPIAKGGDDIAQNIQPLCGSCNSIKGTKIIDYRPDKGAPRWIQKKLF